MNKLLLCFAASLLLIACDKGSAGTAPGGSAAPAAAAGGPECDKVVEAIAALNPPDSRGEPERKLWKAMCAELKADERKCVVGAKTMAEMQNCLPKKPLK
jgi:hypothetical protein